MAKIARQQFIGHPKASRDNMELPAHPFPNPGCGGGLIEADVFATARIGDKARLKLLHPIAVGIHDRGGDALIALICANDDANDAGLSFLSHKLCLRPVVEIPKCAHHGRTPGNTAHLQSLLLIEVQNICSRDRQAVDPALQADCIVAGMLSVKPIGAASPDGVELNALDYAPPVCEVAIAPAIEHIGFKELKLKGNIKAVTCAPGAPPDQDLPCFDHLATSQGLKPQEIELPVSIAAR